MTELEQQLQGLKARKLELETNEKVFIKVQGLTESMEKTRSEIVGLEDDNTAAKESLSELEDQRADLIKKPLIAMQEVMKSVMPEGKEAIIEINEENEVTLGILSTGPSGIVFSPYGGFSGSDKVLFNEALSYALKKNADHIILMHEAAELSSETLIDLIVKLEKEKKAQLLVFSCHTPKTKIDGKKWNINNL